MKVFMIGSTGLLGLEGAKELIKRGHTVVSLALPPLPEGVIIPEGMEVIYINYLEATDEQLKSLMLGCEGFVFAAGIDERVEGVPPIYDLFKKYNIDALKRIMEIALLVGIKHSVILGSYFTYFAKEWASLNLYHHHPYIRSRIDQEKVALSFADKGMDVAVLELPYIFGVPLGRKPVWQFIAEMIHNVSANELYYPTGGTTMVTIKQVAEAIAGALELNHGGHAYPIGWFNMTWKQWLENFSNAMGEPKTVITIPAEVYLKNVEQMQAQLNETNKEPGLNMVEYVKVMTANTFIDKHFAQSLGVTEDDINQAIKESALACVKILENPYKVIIDMKAE